MEILFIVLALILFLGMIADSEESNRRNYSNCFIIVVIAIVVLILCK